MSKTKISACIVTYNQQNFIRECLQGVVNQKLSYDFEIIIGQDNSTDETHKICLEYSILYPNLIKYFPRDKNLGMIGNWTKTLEQCTGNYIAMCEGDDYWTDPYKLQKQVDFLEANPEYILSFHKVKILKPDGSLVPDFITKVPENYETQETLARLGNYIHTPSVVFRNVLKEFPKEFSLSPIGDFFLYMLLAEHGKLNYFEEEMAVYRYGVGIHSTNSQIKMAKANFKLFTLLLSYSKNEVINKILLERQLPALDHFEQLVRNEYSASFVSNHLFFKAIKSLRTPSKFWRKLKSKFK